MFEHTINPIAVKWGIITVHWYGILMAAAFLCGYFILQKLVTERKLRVNVDSYVMYMIIGILGGARLGEIIFYEPLYYLANPLKIFAVWEGGLASHGAMLGGILAHWLFCRKNKIHFYELADVAVIPIALGAAFVRLGNFVNAEIVGRITSVQWAIKFPGAEGFRHPSQLYEAVKNFFLFGLLWNMRNMKLPRGFLFWSFLFMYGILRFFVEFFKDFELFSFGLTLGQLLSIPFIVVSGWMMRRLWKKK
ncbi:MAG: prolipoprotein diacylglyceryl transferase [Candidatus Woesearchaeota archaeon]|nr:prolipoprotein diacylglyceryl transferase [Candidatus Woesearchaeota archaeon]